MKTTKRKSKTAAKTAAPAAAVSAPVADAKASENVSTTAPVDTESAAAALGAAAPFIALASNSTVKDAAALKVELCARANDSADVIVDVAAIERIDTSTMQLLCAFVRDRASRNQKVVWQGLSQSWGEAVRLLGAQQLLGTAAGRAA